MTTAEKLFKNVYQLCKTMLTDHIVYITIAWRTPKQLRLMKKLKLLTQLKQAATNIFSNQQIDQRF